MKKKSTLTSGTSVKLSGTIFNSIISSLRMISRADRLKVYSLAFLNIFLSVIDLLGVILIGLTISLGINGPSKIGDSGRIGSLLKTLNMQEMSFNSIIRTLGLTAILLLVLRSLVS